MAKILGIGNALIDIMTRLDHDEHLELFKLPKGSMTLVDELLSEEVTKGTEHLEKTLASGGSASNTIHGLARLGVQTAFMGKVGKDQFGDFFNEDLVKNGIDPKLFFSEKQSGRAIALVSPDSERTFATYLGAAIDLSKEDLKPEHFKGYDFFHIEGYLVQNHGLIETAVRLAKENNLQVALDLASYNVVEANLDFLRLLVRQYVDIVFANEEEARAFTGKEPREAAQELAELCGIAVVKTGKNGSIIQKGKDIYDIKAVEATCLDTTGAGDLYASGFLYGLAHKLSLDKCGQIGSLLGGRVIEVIGAKLDRQRWEEVLEEVERIKESPNGNLKIES
ncbi:MAG: adenosine kinase [Bacteroidales bacterium]|nr:adenosine kinase [Bacteroidales bacterium]MCF8377594.1 adenosine kinase [Bacteroidales bacterium]MCF8401825.1 adenosine kinase [Bacteroidales bacterium]